MDINKACAEVIASKDRAPESERLHTLFEAHWEWRMADSPELATYVGRGGQNHRLSDLSFDAVAARKAAPLFQLGALASIDRGALSDEDTLNYDLFEWNLRNAEEAGVFPSEFLQISQATGPQASLPRTLEISPSARPDDFDDAIQRLRAIPEFLDQTTALLEAGIAAGVTAPKIVLRDLPEQIMTMCGEGEGNPFLTKFNSPQAPPEARSTAGAVVAESVASAFRKFHDFVKDAYIPKARDSVALGDLPGGDEWYVHLVRRFTTTDLTAKEIHDIGLAEVDRIRKQMDAVIRETGFEGSFEDFSEFLRTDHVFYFHQAGDLLHAYREIAKRADPALAQLFGTLPRLPYGVEPVPAYLEKSATTAYYMPGSPEAGRPGNFFANTYDLPSRPKWEMEALTLHEAVPGHHLQIALAQEMADTPEFRKHGGYTAYVEGWGLYAESLGYEMGFFDDAYSKFGALTYEMWRAIRLVVDTGMHTLGWPRERAIEFFESNSSKALHDITVEIDRYISWPGQALAYKIGELKIKDLRERASRALGDRFDVRAFHDEVLKRGALPLSVLEGRVDSWLAATSSS